MSNEITKTRQLSLIPKYYEVLERVSDIKKEINQALNQGDLIFIHKENFDVKTYKKQIFEDAVTRG